MIAFETKVRVEGLVAYRIYRYFLRPANDRDEPREPGTRLGLEMIRRTSDEVGSVVRMDERIGGRRIRAKAVIVEAVPGRRLVLQVKKLRRLPVWILMAFQDTDGGTDVTHTLKAGYRGVGTLLDPIFRLYFPRRFRRDLGDHVRAEFARLQESLYLDTSEW